jgi:hypothetical protein
MISDTLFEASEEIKDSLKIYNYESLLTSSQISRVVQALHLLDEVRKELDTPPP